MHIIIHLVKDGDYFLKKAFRKNLKVFLLLWKAYRQVGKCNDLVIRRRITIFTSKSTICYFGNIKSCSEKDTISNNVFRNKITKIYPEKFPSYLVSRND